MFYSRGLAGEPVPKALSVCPFLICLAFLSEQYLGTWKPALHSLTKNMQTATGEGTRGGNLHNETL